jgi:secondary thiamine-phosphate synthase enzyme
LFEAVNRATINKSSNNKIMWIQKEIQLEPKSRGYHIITEEILREIPEIKKMDTGLAHIFIKHTSAGLTINENADPSVRRDFESHFNRVVPEDTSLYEHTLEGTDDMTSHIKSSLMGSSLTVPITEGHFNMGTWQGIYLCEHRNRGGSRKLVITLHGE